MNHGIYAISTEFIDLWNHGFNFLKMLKWFLGDIFLGLFYVFSLCLMRKQVFNEQNLMAIHHEKTIVTTVTMVILFNLRIQRKDLLCHLCTTNCFESKNSAN